MSAYAQLIEQSQRRVEEERQAEMQQRAMFEARRDKAIESQRLQAIAMMGDLGEEMQVTLDDYSLKPGEWTQFVDIWFRVRPRAWNPDVNASGFIFGYDSQYGSWFAHEPARRHTKIPIPTVEAWQGSAASALLVSCHVAYEKALKEYQEHQAAMQKRREEDERRALFDRINELLNTFYSARRWHTTREQAAAALETLIKLVPDRADEWRKQHAEWLAAKEDDFRNAAAYQAAKDQYRETYAAWYAQRNEIWQRNAERGRALQQKVNEPFQVWKLVVNVAVVDEDGGRYTDFKDFYVVVPEPNDQGFWSVLEQGEIRRRMFFAPFSLDEAVTYRPTDAPYSLTRTIYDFGQGDDDGVSYLVYRDQEIVDAALAEVERVPAEPMPPDGLSYHGSDANNIRRQVRQEEEIPF